MIVAVASKSATAALGYTKMLKPVALVLKHFETLDGQCHVPGHIQVESSREMFTQNQVYASVSKAIPSGEVGPHPTSAPATIRRKAARQKISMKLGAVDGGASSLTVWNRNQQTFRHLRCASFSFVHVCFSWK